MTHPELLVVCAFLSGSVPYGLLIGFAKGHDVRKEGSGNIGSTNVGRVLGRKYFFICFALDVLKGLLPTLAAGYFLGCLGDWAPQVRDLVWWMGAMVASVLGHVFSPWLKFKGGKGVATALGTMLGVFPALTLAGTSVFLVWLLAVKLWRYVSVASILAAVLLPVSVVIEFVAAEQAGWITVGWFSAAWPFLIVASLLSAIVLWTHRGNMKRLRAGTEPKVGERKAS